MKENYFSATNSLSKLITIPNFVTLLRFGLCWPMILALQEQNLWIFIWLVILFLGLDILDGKLARLLRVESAFGKTLDSFVDKATFLIILIVAVFYHLLPFSLLFFILGVNAVQLSLTWWQVFQRSKKFPATYLQGITAGALILSLFLKEPLSYLVYFLIVVLSINHLYYYGKQLYPRESRRVHMWLKERLDNLRSGILKLPVLKEIGSYSSFKSKRRNIINSPDAKIYTFANLVTFFRILLIPLIIHYYLLDQTSIWILLLVVFVGGDFVDGAIARHFNQVSRIGKILDAVADKALLFAFLVVWLFQGLLPVWLFGFIMIRIFLILIMASLIFFFTKKTLPIAFFSFISVICLLLFIYWQSDFWLILTILFTWQLIVNYWYQGMTILLKDTKRVSFGLLERLIKSPLD